MNAPFGLPGTPLDPSDPINKGLIGWWPMWEGAGGKCLDISGNNKHGTLTNGPVWAGDAIDCDGTNDEINSGLVTSAKTNVTMCAWVWPRVLPDEHRIMLNGTGGGLTGWSMSISQDYVYGGAGDIFGGVVEGYEFVRSGWVVPNQKWSFLLITIKDYTWRFYANGAFISEKTAANLPGTPTTGSRIVTALDGRISNARFFNRIISDAEIRQLYINPYEGLWVPDITRYYVPAAGGGGGWRHIIGHGDYTGPGIVAQGGLG